jgi:hypothetical protein
MSFTPDEIAAQLEELLPVMHNEMALAASSLNAWQIVRGELARSQSIGKAVRAILDQAIDSIRPIGEIKDIPEWRYYSILDGLYRKQQKPVQVYRELNISKAHFHRQRIAAVKALATLLFHQESALKPQGEWRAALPAPSYSCLFGANALIERVVNALANRNGPPVVVIDGFGGIGKTSAGRAAALQAMTAGLFQTLIWQTAQRALLTWGEIQTLDRPAFTADALLNHIARASGMSQIIPMPAEIKTRAIHGLLNEIPTLLVVDNLETAVDVRALVDTLYQLVGGPATKILLTSRQQLGTLNPMVACHVQPLTCADTLAFVRHHAAEQGEMELAGASDAVLRPIHDVTGGHPLAIKLVVGQANALPLEQILDRLRNARASEALYAFIYRQSWKMISADAQEILLSLPHLAPGGAAWQDIETVSELPSQRLNAALEELTRFSLVNCAGDGTKTYSLHPLMRHFIVSDLMEQWGADSAHE